MRRTAQAPQEESKRGADASRGAGIATSSARAEAKSGGRGSSTAGEVQGSGTGGDAGAGGGRLSIRDLQGVFSSSLVSSASLDYLSIASIMDDDYADIRYGLHACQGCAEASCTVCCVQHVMDCRGGLAAQVPADVDPLVVFAFFL